MSTSIVTEQESIARSLEVLAFNYASVPEAQALVGELEGIPTIAEIEEVLTDPASQYPEPLRITFRLKILQDFSYYWGKRWAVGSSFCVVVQEDLLVNDVTSGRNVILPAGEYRMRLSLFFLKNGGDEKAYPWLVDELGRGAHVVWFHQRSWKECDVSVAQC